MDRIILPYAGGPAGPPARSTGPTVLSPQPTRPVKTSGDYVRALRQRFWLALAVAGLVMVIGAIVVVRQPAIYRATAQIMIEPPQFDSILSNLVANEVGTLHRETSVEQYAPNQLAQIRSRDLVQRVLYSHRVGPRPESVEDLARELLKSIQYNRIPQTTQFEVHLEGRDPTRTAKILQVWLEEFASDSEQEVSNKISFAQNSAQVILKTMEGELRTLDESIIGDLKSNPHFSPDGDNLLQRQYETMEVVRIQKQMRYDELQRETLLGKYTPKPEMPMSLLRTEQKLDELYKQHDYWAQMLERAKRTVRNLNDPSVRSIVSNLRQVEQQMATLRASMAPAEVEPQGNPADLVLAQTRKELNEMKQQEERLFQRIQDNASGHNKFLMQLKDRDRKAENIAQMRKRLTDFDLLAQSQPKPIKIVQGAIEPTVPARPNRRLSLAIVAVLAIGLGVALVVALEHLDHSVRVPEHLTSGLALPLVGVVPRMKRIAALHRGGHLWTPGLPSSAEADAYRNLRASLIGLQGPKGPIVTLLVTSAKAGEGKSTTALNLAATCARAGERTLLMDVDLRRPSLGEVFDDGAHTLGLVDVLRGDLPWQRTLVRTDIPNLDFLPTGDPSGIPIEILGALELRQLLTALSGHYDRVILDSPAILGLADCRMLGRVVDGALLVVRSGAHELRPLARAKSMLEQSKVFIAGVVFNNLSDDIKNWSCHGPHGYGDRYHGEGESRPALTTTQGLDATPSNEPAALTAAD